MLNLLVYKFAVYTMVYTSIRWTSSMAEMGTE